MALRFMAGLALAMGTAAAAPPALAPQDGDAARGALIASGSRAAQGATACFRCHGVGGGGDAAGAVPRLAGLDAYYLGKQLRDYAAGTRRDAVMAPIAAALSGRDILDVAAHYAGMAPSPPPTPAGDEPQIATGRQLFNAGRPDAGLPACAACHGPGGVSTAPAVPTLAAQHAEYIAAQLHGWRNGRRRNDPLGNMARFARRLSEGDIAAVAAYLAAARLPGDA